MSKVSVVMATYNGESFLLEQLNSLLNQSRRPDEVIICDDCSNDHTVEIVESFIRNNMLDRWSLVVNKKNLGYIDNFRNALRMADGDIIFLADQDDVWDSEKIREMVKIMEENSNILSLACSSRLIDKHGKSIVKKRNLYYSNNNFLHEYVSEGCLHKVGRSVLVSNISQGCTTAYRKQVVKKYCACKEKCIMPHDWAMNIIAENNNGLFFINRELISYRLHNNNAIGIMKGITTRQERIEELTKYKRMIIEAKELYVTGVETNELDNIIKLINKRINSLKKSSVLWWALNGIINFRVIVKLFLFSYIRDLRYILYVEKD